MSVTSVARARGFSRLVGGAVTSEMRHTEEKNRTLLPQIEKQKVVTVWLWYHSFPNPAKLILVAQKNPTE